MNKPYTEFFKSVLNALESFKAMPEKDRPQGYNLEHYNRIIDKAPSGRVRTVKTITHVIPINSFEAYWLEKHEDDFIDDKTDRFSLVMSIRMIPNFEIAVSVMMYHHTEGQVISSDEEIADQILKENGNLYACSDLFTELEESYAE